MSRIKPKTKTQGELREIYVMGSKEPAAAIDDLHNLYHKPTKFQVEQGTIYRIESELNSQSHYFEQKYRRKEIIWECKHRVEEMLGDSWYWNWNNFAVRALHMRVMNFTLPFDYHKVWFGEILKGQSKFPELMFEEELRLVDAVELKTIQDLNTMDEQEMIKRYEQEKKEKLEKGGEEELRKGGGEFHKIK